MRHNHMMQLSIVLGVKTSLAARKAVRCTQKTCRGPGSLWFGYTICPLEH